MMIKRGILAGTAMLFLCGYASTNTLLEEQNPTYVLIMQTGEQNGTYRFSVRQSGANPREFQTRDLPRNWQEVETLEGYSETVATIHISLPDRSFSCDASIVPEPDRNYLLRPVISTIAGQGSQCNLDVLDMSRRPAVGPRLSPVIPKPAD